MEVRSYRAVNALVGSQHVLREQTANNVWALHVAVFVAHQHLVAHSRLKESAATLGGHRSGNAYPG